MNTHYVLPVCVAAAVHGALLFGFSKESRPTKIVAEITTCLIPFPLAPPPEPDVIELSEPSDSAPPSPPDRPQPVRSLEPPPIEVSDRQTMTLPPIAPPGVKAVNVIPEFPPGVGNGNGKGPWTDILSTVDLDNAPRTRFQPAPMYPFDAKRDGVTGEVIVEFLVDEHGRVLEPRIVRSTHRVFEEATLRAVAKWRFEPGRRDGKVVRFRMAAPVVFSLNE